ncbi:MAG: MFS transporter [Streptosporangiales bacterium]|nr:MFS transporter [Streptosporangiales bacterium]
MAEFRALWSADLLSEVGDQLARVALAVLVYQRTSSAVLTALTYALTLLPSLLGGTLLSGLADRLPRRRVMITCQLLQAGMVALAALPGTPLALLCVLVFLVQLADAPAKAARMALLPQILLGDRYVAGQAIGHMTRQSAVLGGFAAGGIVVQAIGPYLALVVNAATFLFAAAIEAVGVRPRPAPRDGAATPGAMWASLGQGVALITRSPRLRSLAALAWLAGCYAVPLGLAAPYAAELGGSPVTVGFLMATAPAGSLIGVALFTRLVPPEWRGRLMGPMAVLTSLPLVFCALRPSVGVSTLLWAAVGVFSAYQVAANAAFMRTVPDTSRGQAGGLVASGLVAVQGLGILLGGLLAEGIGAARTVAVAGALGVTLGLFAAYAWRRARIRTPEPAGETVSA